MQQLELFKANLPKKARSCNNFKLDNKVRYLNEAILKKYIQYNDFNSFTWLVFDLDYSVNNEMITNDLGMPEPTLLVSNPSNRHAHAYYLLEQPVHNNIQSSKKALKLFSIIEYGLMRGLKADNSFVGMLGKNALHKHWQIIPSFGGQYTLSELSEYVPDNDFKGTNVQTGYGAGRNCEVFETVARWSYKAIRQGWPEYTQWYKAVETRVMAINSKFDTPLEYREYKHIAKSIATWTHQRFTEQGFSEWQSKQGKKGGMASGKVRTEKNADKRSQALEFRSQGLTQKAIAEHLGVSRMPISRWLKIKGVT